MWFNICRFAGPLSFLLPLRVAVVMRWVTNDANNKREINAFIFYIYGFRQCELYEEPVLRT